MYKALFAMKGNESFTLPTEDGLTQHYRRICGAFIHISSTDQLIPNNEVVFNFGFCKKDKSKEISLKNCVYHLNTLEQRPVKQCPAIISTKGAKRRGEVCGRTINGTDDFCPAHNGFKNCTSNSSVLEQHPVKYCPAIISTKGAKRRGEVCGRTISFNVEFCPTHNRGKSKAIK